MMNVECRNMRTCTTGEGGICRASEVQVSNSHDHEARIVDPRLIHIQSQYFGNTEPIFTQGSP